MFDVVNETMTDRFLRTVLVDDTGVTITVETVKKGSRLWLRQVFCNGRRIESLEVSHSLHKHIHDGKVGQIQREGKYWSS